jgi:hypothetical protein
MVRHTRYLATKVSPHLNGGEWGDIHGKVVKVKHVRPHQNSTNRLYNRAAHHSVRKTSCLIPHCQNQLGDQSDAKDGSKKDVTGHRRAVGDVG